MFTFLTNYLVHLRLQLTSLRRAQSQASYVDTVLRNYVLQTKSKPLAVLCLSLAADSIPYRLAYISV